jgi:hypothetical protein
MIYSVSPIAHHLNPSHLNQIHNSHESNIEYLGLHHFSRSSFHAVFNLSMVPHFEMQFQSSISIETANERSVLRDDFLIVIVDHQLIHNFRGHIQ